MGKVEDCDTRLGIIVLSISHHHALERAERNPFQFVFHEPIHKGQRFTSA